MNQKHDTSMDMADYNDNVDRHNNSSKYPYAGGLNKAELNNEYWERFEKSGEILDYLSYSACTKV